MSDNDDDDISITTIPANAPTLKPGMVVDYYSGNSRMGDNRFLMRGVIKEIEGTEFDVQITMDTREILGCFKSVRVVVDGIPSEKWWGLMNVHLEHGVAVNVQNPNARVVNNLRAVMRNSLHQNGLGQFSDMLEGDAEIGVRPAINSTPSSSSLSSEFSQSSDISEISNASNASHALNASTTSTNITSSTPSHHMYLPKGQQHLLLAQITSLLTSVAAFDYLDCLEDHMDSGRKEGAETVRRERLDMNKYIAQAEERGFRRRYRMNKDAFWTLLDIIERHLPSTGEKRKRGAVPNGPISKAARLSMAIRFFAGGDPLDIAEMHGVGEDEPMTSVWDVVDAIHKASELDIKFPETHMEQTESMLQFKEKSSIDIDCCVGAIDGMLIWMNKPSSTHGQ